MRYLRSSSSSTRRRFCQQHDDVLTFKEVAKWLIDTLRACFRSIVLIKVIGFLLFSFPRSRLLLSVSPVQGSKDSKDHNNIFLSLPSLSALGVHFAKSVAFSFGIYTASQYYKMWNPAGQSFSEQTSPSTRSTNTRWPSCPASKRSTSDCNTDLTFSSSSSRCLPSSFCCKSDLVLVQVGSWISYLIFFSLALSILITFSSPFITTIYFLRAGVVNFGAFGYNSPGFRSEDVLGYEYGLQVLNPLTNAMILWGIGKPGVE